jgi:hypothetical protein
LWIPVLDFLVDCQSSITLNSGQGPCLPICVKNI